MTETDQAAAEAAAEAGEEIASAEIDEELPDEPNEETPEGHKERSELGRKVKGIEDQVGFLSEQVQNFISKLEQKRQQQQTDELDFVDTSNPQTLEEFLDRRDQAKEQKKKEYTQQALSSLKSQGVDLSQKAYNAVCDEAVNNWTKHTGDPAIDARLNFLDARVRIRERQLKTRTNPLSKNTDQDAEGLGGESGSRIDQRVQVPPKLSEAAQGFVNDHLKKTNSKILEKL